jgi:hypothetical protein
MSSLAPVPNPEVLSSQEPVMPGSELEQVLESRAFGKTPTLKKLLTYLWEHQCENISEYAIATEALGRRADFEPRIDATVRVLVSRLRHRLKEYYDAEGACLPTRIAIPLGTHRVQILRVRPETVSQPFDLLPLTVVDQPTTRQPILSLRHIAWIQLAIILILIFSNGWTLWLRNRQKHESEPGQVRNFPEFWRQFLGNGKGAHLIVPNPVFFSWENGLFARDRRVNDFLKRDDSPVLEELERRFGPPTLSQQYVPSPDLFASLRLTRYLDPQGTQMRISTTAEVSASDLDHENVIILGNPNTLAPLQAILDQLSFRVDVPTRSVIDRRTVPGMPREFTTVEQSESRISTPGIVASLPGGQGGNHVLILVTTYYTSALVSYLTSEAGLRELHNAQANSGNHPYFEAVIVSEIDGSTTLRGKLVEFRPYIPQS